MINLSINVNLEMIFLNLHNLKVDFLELEIFWRIYFFIETISTTNQVILVRNKEFAFATFDLEDKIYIIHIASISSLNSHIYFSKQAEIKSFPFANLSITIMNKYKSFANIFSIELMSELPEYI